MRYLKQLSMATRLNLLVGLMAATLGTYASLAIIGTSKSHQQLRSVRDSYQTIDLRVIPLLRIVGEIELDVTQVQQFLTDISATRGLDGLDDGFKKAEENAAGFAKHMESALDHARALQEGALEKALADLMTTFTPYYTTGKMMAAAYVTIGPSAGNKMMPVFDKGADGMREALESVKKQTLAIAESRRTVTERSFASLESNLTVQQVTGLAAVLIAITFAVIVSLLVRRHFSIPVTRLANTITKIAGGQTYAQIPYREHGDELGDMAKAIAILQQAMVERDRLQAEEASNEAEREVRRELLTSLIDCFNGKVANIMQNVTAQAASIDKTASTLSQIAHISDEQAGSVHRVSQQSATAVNHAAGAATELSASIGEINHQVTTASTVVRQAEQLARETNQGVTRLADAADKIGTMVELIRSIAGQTNLLALNATIEAARAGDAGRGFAVVAQEVKGLAAQVGQATDDISALVGDIQGSTHSAVTAIGDIMNTMIAANAATTAISSAVQQQAAATQEISRNISETAHRSDDLTEAFGAVTKTISETNHSAQGLSALARELSEHADQLREEMTHFTREVAVA